MRGEPGRWGALTFDNDYWVRKCEGLWGVWAFVRKCAGLWRLMNVHRGMGDSIYIWQSISACEILRNIRRDPFSKKKHNRISQRNTTFWCRTGTRKVWVFIIFWCCIKLLEMIRMWSYVYNTWWVSYNMNICGSTRCYSRAILSKYKGWEFWVRDYWFKCLTLKAWIWEN